MIIAPTSAVLASERTETRPRDGASDGHRLHAALLADARTSVAAWVDGEELSDTEAALALATGALAGSGDAAEVFGLAGRLVLS